MKKKLNKRLVCGATALLLAAAVMLPTSLASAAEEEFKNYLNEEGSETTKSTLLVGDISPDKADTFEGTVQNLEDKYLLGVASEFSVFLNGDFTVKESDTEGRAAIGGDLIQETTFNYEIGKGEAETYIPIDALLGNSNFANIVLAGTTNKEIADFYYDDLNEQKQSKKKIVLQSSKAITDGVIPEQSNNRIDQSQAYISDLIDFEKSFKLITERSELLAEQPSNGTVDFITDSDGKTRAVFTYTGKETTAESVYFDLADKELEKFKDAQIVEFKNIPKLPTARDIVKTSKVGDRRTATTDNWEYAYIVVNIKGTDNFNGYAPASVKDDTAVFLADPSYEEKFTIINDTYVSRENDTEIPKNNKPGTDSIIYNLPNATKVVLVTNFQGSILAPRAHVTDYAYEYLDKAVNPRGHLSGALIAQSFSGSTQFTFRTCRAPFSLIKKDEKIEQELTFTKEWDCSTDILPSAETFMKWLTVKEGGETLTLDTDYTIEVDTEGTEWTVTVTILDYNDDAVYTVTETLADGYEEAFTSSGDVTLGTKDAKIIITNTLKDIDSVTVTVNKEWVETNNPNTAAAHADVKANVEITCGSETVYDEDITLTDPDWSWTYPDELPAYEWVKNSDGTLSKNELTYDVDVTEVTIGGYITTYKTDKDSNNNITVTITNTYNYGQLLGKLTVNKNWEGYEGLGGHPNISFELTDSAGNSYSGKWTTGDTVYVFENLPVYDGENLMKYTLSETISAKNNDFNEVTIVKNPFTLSQNGDDFTAEVTVTNEYIAYDPLEITKIWDTSANSSAVIPDSIDVEITGTANGEVVIEKDLTIKPEDYDVTNDGKTWSYTITDLPKYYFINSEPCEITYQIKETNIEGFTSSAENPVDIVDGAVTITNTADKIEESSDDSDSSESGSDIDTEDSDSSDSSSDIDTEDSDSSDSTGDSDDTSNDDTSSSESDNDSGLGNQDASNGSSGGVGTGTGSNSKNDNSPKTGRTVGALMLAATALSMAVVASKKKKS